MKQKGFTLIKLIIVIAILGIIAAVVIPTISQYIERANNSTTVHNATIFSQLSLEPISSLNLTDLNFMVDYCIQRHTHYRKSAYWSTLAVVYQNQIITNQLQGQMANK